MATRKGLKRLQLEPAEPSGLKASDVRLRQACTGLEQAIAALSVDLTDRPGPLETDGHAAWRAWRKAEAERRVDAWNGWYKVGEAHRLTVDDVEAIVCVLEDIQNVLYKLEPINLVRDYLVASRRSERSAESKYHVAHLATIEAWEAWRGATLQRDKGLRMAEKRRVAVRLVRSLQMVDANVFRTLNIDAVHEVLERFRRRSAAALLRAVADTCGAWPGVAARAFYDAKRRVKG